MKKKELVAEMAALRAEVAVLRAELAAQRTPTIVPYPVPYYPQRDWWSPTYPQITCSSDSNTTAEVRYIGSAS